MCVSGSEKNQLFWHYIASSSCNVIYKKGQSTDIQRRHLLSQHMLTEKGLLAIQKDILSLQHDAANMRPKSTVIDTLYSLYFIKRFRIALIFWVVCAYIPFVAVKCHGLNRTSMHAR